MRKFRMRRKIISIIMSSFLLIQIIPVTALANGDMDSDDTTQYVVMMKDIEQADSYAQQFIETFENQEEITDQEIMLDHDIFVAELTNKEAAKLERYSDVLFVEKDILLEGNLPEEYTSTENEFLESLESGYRSEFELEAGEEVETVTKVEKEPETQCFEETELSSEIEISAEVESNNKELMNKNLEVNAIDYSSEQWNLSAIHLPDIIETGEPVRIGILDSGVSYTNDIEIKENISCILEEGDVNPIFEDMIGHGTGVAGIIGAKDNGKGIRGINPNADLYSIKVLNEENKTSLSCVVGGIYEAINQNCDIINMSFGTTVNSDILYTAIREAYDMDILLIAAGGNTNGGAVEYPAAYDEVMAVGATNALGEWMEDTSNGAELEILAPGDQILTTGLFSGVIITSGTSIAAAQVSGAASLLWEKDKSKSADFIRRLMDNTAQGVDNVPGQQAGLLDIEKAFELYEEFNKVYVENKIAYKEIEVKNREAEKYDDVTLVNGLWGATGHKDLVSYGGESNDVSSANINIMKETVLMADRLYSSTNALHGTGNYITSLKFLYKCAAYLRSGNTHNQAVDKAYNSLRVQNATLTTLKDTTLLMLNNNKTYDTATKKYYSVLGLAMHLTGDIFAHRTIVPKYTVSGTNPAQSVNSSSVNSTNARFGTVHFLTQGNHPICSDTKLIAWAKSSANNASSICKRWGCFQRTVNLGYMEFKDIKNFGVSANAGIYEDQRNFCSDRYADAEFACWALIMYSNDKEVYAGPDIFVPYYKNVVLEHFKTYTEKEYTATECKEYGYNSTFFKGKSFDW